MRILLASTNPHKVQEITEILSTIDWREIEIVTLKDFPKLLPVEEDGKTFEDNAIKKAVTYARASGLPTIADDSGLCVDALNGDPSVLSARYAGSDQNALRNCTKLLKALENIPPAGRSAHFVCAVALAGPEALAAVARGRVDGLITHELRGSGGFGYDPVFLYPPLGKTFAELSTEAKNQISHRAEALRALHPHLEAYIASRKNR